MKQNSKITIFIEASEWQTDNIMNNTYYDRATDSFVISSNNELRIETEYVTNEGFVGDKLWQYMHHAYESEILVRILKYIRKHKDRINIIGVDNDKLARDFDMANKII